jgi:alpha-N-acetylglucosaminidase
MTSDDHYLVGSWINSALSWSDVDDRELMELNARAQVTLWGPPSDMVLNDYAYKLWNGLVGDFYK